jgi:hypothetical protein
MNVIVSFPVERARQPGEGVPGIVAVRGCEIREFPARRAAVPPAPARVPAPAPARAPIREPMFSLDILPRRLRRTRPASRLLPALPDDDKQEPLARLRGLSAQDSRDEIGILLQISDTDLAVTMLVALLGASNTHKPLPYGWPRVMYAIRGRLSLYVACGRTDSDRLIQSIRELLAEEADTAWA